MTHAMSSAASAGGLDGRVSADSTRRTMASAATSSSSSVNGSGAYSSRTDSVTTATASSTISPDSVVRMVRKSASF